MTRNMLFAFALAAFHFSSHAAAQSCANLEPTDPYCFLPFYQDKEVNATFDNVAARTRFTEYPDVEWQGLISTAHGPHNQLLPQSLPNYATASTGKTVVPPTADYDYIYLSRLHFGCTNTTANGTLIAVPCSLQIQGTCLPVGFPGYIGGQLEPLTWTYQSQPQFLNATAATMTYASPLVKTTYKGTTKTNHPVLCTNYTLAAQNPYGHAAALVLDNVQFALYYDPPSGLPNGVHGAA